MTREHSIPLFLWVATALVVHAIGGGGATEVSEFLQEKLDIQSFARAVSRQASLSGKPVEVSLDLEEPPEEELPEADGPDETEDEKKADVDPEDALPPPPDKKKEEEKKAPPEKKPEEKKPEEKKPALNEPTPTPTPPAELQGRIAVQQHVEDKNQKDNPNARQAAEHANHVEEETRARITSTDKNESTPTLGGTFAGGDPNPGNSQETKIAQSEESPGEKAHPPGEKEPSPTPPPTPANSTSAPPAAMAGAKAPAPAPAPATRAQDARPTLAERAPVPDVHAAPNGSFGMPSATEGQAAQRARKQLPEQRSKRPTDLLGYGAMGRTANGVNLNLTPQMAVAAIGADKLAMERKAAGERRLSQHRGSWQSLDFRKWQPALENYVASVKPGNQTALNTARVPFATYLNEVHNRIHPVFADHFLGQLSSLPGDHPLNNMNMSTHLEVKLSGQDGRVLRLGITKSSGVTAFDVMALDAVNRAGPYGTPPSSILSSDGNVYLHWEFHRRPELACSTYFARPFILNLKQEEAPTQPTPPPAPSYDAPQRDERTGALEPGRPPAKGEHARRSHGG